MEDNTFPAKMVPFQGTFVNFPGGTFAKHCQIIEILKQYHTYPPQGFLHATTRIVRTFTTNYKVGPYQLQVGVLPHVLVYKAIYGGIAV